MVRSFAFCTILSFFISACSSNNVTVDKDLGRYFNSAGVNGSFALFDNGHGHFTIYNLSRYSDSFYAPGATFDILQSLIAVQLGVVKDDHASIGQASDSSQDAFRGHQPATLGECFRDSGGVGELGFAELGTRELHRDTIRKWIDSLQYGNKNMGDSAHPLFWANGVLTINSDQQLGLVKKLYFNQLPFFNRTQEIVRDMFSTENTSSYTFRYKLAQVPEKGGGKVGWAMGWVEENKHPYFFVVNVESADPQKDLRSAALDITRKILRQLGFFQGLK